MLILRSVVLSGFSSSRMPASSVSRMKSWTTVAGDVLRTATFDFIGMGPWGSGQWPHRGLDPRFDLRRGHAAAEERRRDHDALDLGRALVELRHLRIAVVPLDRELLRVSVPT